MQQLLAVINRSRWGSAASLAAFASTQGEGSGGEDGDDDNVFHRCVFFKRVEISRVRYNNVWLMKHLSGKI
jgi:hypothetical protein